MGGADPDRTAQRYAPLQRTAPEDRRVSEKMLAQSLQALARDGFVSRVSHPVVPPFVEYSLTPMGEEVAGKVADLADWIELNLLRVMEARSSAQADPAATEGRHAVSGARRGGED
ncbi:winged helix-turn-helix transcriptional regulator [Microbulbifer sp.]|uniref:winged helix-turn-helix transcriptional regulator n=1 Tax=Microbulbifer sp. TaxID=1908541 RepID=UPI003F360F35